MQMQNLAIIPARFASRRFPGKLLERITDDHIIIHTLSRVLQAKLVGSVFLATDHDLIESAVRNHALGIQCNIIRTPSCLESGTHRVAWTVSKVVDPNDLHRTIVVNVQGDQPTVNPEHVDEALRLALECSEGQVATLCTPIRSLEEFNDRNVVKCVTDSHSNAMYFSRAGIPFISGKPKVPGSSGDQPDASADRCPNHWLAKRHLGIYAYRADILVNEISKMEPCMIDMTENLEQLRWMFHGIRIRAGMVDTAGHSVDEPRDIARLEDELQGHRLSEIGKTGLDM